MNEGIIQKIFNPTIESYKQLLALYSTEFKGITREITCANLKNFIHELERKKWQLIAEIEKELPHYAHTMFPNGKPWVMHIDTVKHLLIGDNQDG